MDNINKDMARMVAEMREVGELPAPSKGGSHNNLLRYNEMRERIFEKFLSAFDAGYTLTPPNEWVSVEDELPKLPDCDKCSMMVNTARKGNPKSFPMIYERAIVRGKRVERWKYYWDKIADEPPDYWMYLPKPPTKEA